VEERLKGWGLPDEEYMTCIEGLPENHYYRDMRWMDWSDYDAICRDAEQLLRLIEEYPDEDDLYQEAEDNMVYYLDLDPEVAPVVAALAAVGAVPFTSCSGQEGHYEKHPLVAFWAEPSLEQVLTRAAENVGVNLDDTGLGGFVVWHMNHEPLRAFAEALRERDSVEGEQDGAR
jgi:hypothetical protein